MKKKKLGRPVVFNEVENASSCAKLIRQVRELYGFSQKDLAKRLEVSIGFISNIEKDRAPFPSKLINKLNIPFELEKELRMAIIERSAAYRKAFQ